MAGNVSATRVTALLRVCDVHSVPLATNLGSAEALVRSLIPSS